MSNIFIRKLERFASLTSQDRAAAEELTLRQVRRLNPREDLLREGDDPRHVHVILEGWACRYKQLPDGRRGIVSFFLPGDICDPDIFLLTRMDHSIGTLTHTTISRLSPETFAEAAVQPVLAQHFRREMLASLAIQREWTFGLGHRSALERLAHLLCELFFRLQMVGLADDQSCELPITQLDLGEALGLTSVHVNRTLQDLRSAGLITLRGRQLTIHHLGRLKAAALFDPTYLHGGDTVEPTSE